MSIESAADRLGLLKSLGGLVTLSDGHSNRDVYGVLEREFVAVDEVEGYRPILVLRDEDSTRHATNPVVRGSLVTAGSESFTVVGIQPDGTGMTSFILEES